MQSNCYLKKQECSVWKYCPIGRQKETCYGSSINDVTVLSGVGENGTKVFVMISVTIGVDKYWRFLGQVMDPDRKDPRKYDLSFIFRFHFGQNFQILRVLFKINQFLKFQGLHSKSIPSRQKVSSEQFKLFTCTTLRVWKNVSTLIPMIGKKLVSFT